MTNEVRTIVARKGLAANLPAYTSEGELFYATDTKQTYIGDASNNKLHVPTADTGNNISLLAGLGPELCPALSTGNWNLGTGWVYQTGPNRLAKTADGSNLMDTTAASTIVANTRYKVVLTLDSVTLGSVNSTLRITIGGTLYPASIDVAGTYTFFLVSLTTGKITIQGAHTADRFAISQLSVKTATAGQGGISADGDVRVRSLVIQETIIAPSISYTMTADTHNLSFGGTRPRAIYLAFGGNFTLTGLALNQVDGQEVFLTNNSSSFYFICAHENGFSSAGNRFQTATSQDMYCWYAETLKCEYRGGTQKSWRVTKVSNTVGVLTRPPPTGGTPDDYFNSLLANSESMVIGAGQTTVYLDNLSSKTSKMGDTQGVGNGNRIEIDDANFFVRLWARTDVQVISPNSNERALDIVIADTFADKLMRVASPVIIGDKTDSTAFDAVEPSALLEVRSNGVDAFRGFLPPRMSESNRDAISSPAEGLMIYNTDAHTIDYWAGSAWKSLAVL